MMWGLGMATFSGTPADWLWFIGLGGALGITGQFIRAVGGIKKTADQARTMNSDLKDVFSGPVFLTSLATGFAAGVLAALATQPTEIGRTFLLSIIAAGYAGSDFIEAFMRKSWPDMQQLLNKSGQDGGASAGAAKAASDAAVREATAVASALQQPPNVAAPAAYAPPAASAAAAMPQLFNRVGHDISIPDEVRGVIARSKGLPSSDVTDGRKLGDIGYSEGDCFALEWAINRYFFNELRLVFDRLLDGPEDIKVSHTVADVVAKVRSLHPRQRA